MDVKEVKSKRKTSHMKTKRLGIKTEIHFEGKWAIIITKLPRKEMAMRLAGWDKRFLKKDSN